MGMKITPPRVVELLQEQKRRAGSIYAIATRTGIHQNTITKLLAGTSEPSQSTLEKLSLAYGKPVAWLRGDVQEVPIPEGMVDMIHVSPTKRELWGKIETLPEEKAKALLQLLS